MHLLKLFSALKFKFNLLLPQREGKIGCIAGGIVFAPVRVLAEKPQASAEGIPGA